MFERRGFLKMTISAKMSTEDLVKVVMNESKVSYQEAINMLLELTQGKGC